MLNICASILTLSIFVGMLMYFNNLQECNTIDEFRPALISKIATHIRCKRPTVTRVKCHPKKRDFLRFRSEGFPVVFPSQDAPGRKFQEFCDFMTAWNRTLKIRVSYYNPSNTREFVKMRGEKYCKKILMMKNLTGDVPYGGNIKLEKSEEELLKIVPPKHLISSRFTKTALWFGPKDTFTPMHSDTYDNIAVQISGTKRWYLQNPRCFGMKGKFQNPHETWNKEKGKWVRNRNATVMWFHPFVPREWDLTDGCVEIVDVSVGESLYVPMS